MTVADPTYLTEIVVVAGGTMASAIGLMWKHVTAREKEQDVKLDHCEKEHDKTREELKELNRVVGVLEGRQEGVEQLAQAALNEITRVSMVAAQVNSNNQEIQKE